MRNQDAANALTLDRYEFMRQRQINSTPQASALMGINEVPVMDPLKLSNRLSMPSVQQPLDDPNAPAPTVVMPVESGYAPRLVPVSPAPGAASAP